MEKTSPTGAAAGGSPPAARRPYYPRGATLPLARLGRRWPVYLQVNAAADPAKGGILPEETVRFVMDLADRPHLVCRGLMTMARLDADEADARGTFRTLRELRDEVVRRGLGDEPPDGLSMGMTDDFEWAVEEGATVVRVGTAIFEGVDVSASATSGEGRP